MSDTPAGIELSRSGLSRSELSRSELRAVAGFAAACARTAVPVVEGRGGELIRRLDTMLR